MSVERPGEANPTEYQYDSASNLRYVTDALNHTSEAIYDERFRVTEQIDANEESTLYTYTDANELETLTDSASNMTTWVYDGAGRIASETNELNYTRFYNYDAYGRLAEYTDRNSRVTTYDYDNLNHLSAENWDKGFFGYDTTSYDFDAVGNLRSIGKSGITYEYDYDSLDRQISVTQYIAQFTPLVIQFNRTFDGLDRVTTSSATIDSTLDYKNSYVYDTLGRLKTLIQADQAGNAVSPKRIDFSYNAANQLTNIDRYAGTTTANGVASSLYGYDEFGRLESINHTATATGSTFAETHTYGYDNANRLSTYTNLFGGIDVTYGYDDRDQLTSVDATGTLDDEAYNYDDNGNRGDDITNSIGTFDYDVDLGNRMTTDGTYTYEYDHEGNVTTKTEIASGDYTLYQWDFRNRLTSVLKYRSDDHMLQSVAYQYDALNQMVVRTVWDGVEIDSSTFVYDNGQTVLQFDYKNILTEAFAGELSHRYLSGQADDQLFTDEQVDWGDTDADGEVLWAMTDAQGSVRDVVDSNGKLRIHRQYDSFGNVADETHLNTSGTPVYSGTGYVDEAFGFTGRWLDKDTKLQNNHNRWYDSFSGRFISEDPIGFAAGDANLYRYVGNSPLNFVDPTGLAPLNTQGKQGESGGFWHSVGEWFHSMFAHFTDAGMEAAAHTAHRQAPPLAVGMEAANAAKEAAGPVIIKTKKQQPWVDEITKAHSRSDQNKVDKKTEEYEDAKKKWIKHTKYE